ncbi:MAG: pyridoxal-phosphate dependent enzyme [Fibrobacter sp.]|jgi:D-cysteine desulfhydrase|nr:pyridoxal-phosphate dependent enzyme [Fibrobacter sp.]
MIPLFSHYPLLAVSLNYYKIGNLPTPLQKLEKLGRNFSRDDLFIKRDDLSSELYGGNKIRKLEFIFGEVIASGFKQVLTSGAAGSNHALAVALHGAQAGLKVTLMLFDQPYNAEISKNLQADYASGAQMYLDSTYESHLVSMNRVINEIGADQIYVIPPGGSSLLGVCGYINAAFELKEQIQREVIPEPEAIYVALGTMGTAVGLILGLKAAGLKSRVVAVQIAPFFVSDHDKFMALFESTNRMLHDKDPSFPIIKLTHDDFVIDSNFLGMGYGHITTESSNAIQCLKNTEDIKLDGVYTGKAFASFLQAAGNDKHNGPLLFWNTKNSVPLPAPKKGFNYRELPEGFHKYFKM